MTIVEMIVVAALRLDEEGREQFSAEDLVVKAWTLFPDRFGLQGYAERFPDSNRVLTKIMGTGGVRARGWIARTGEKTYRLTAAGRQVAQDLQPRTNGNKQRLASLDRELVLALARMLRSSAVRKYRQGAELTFGDLADFWNVSARSTANQLTVRQTESRAALDAARLLIEAGQAELPGEAITVSKDEVAVLDEISQTLETEFASELAIIRSRRHEGRR